MCKDNIEDEYKELLSLITKTQLIMFNFDKYPLILTVAIEVCKLIKNHIRYQEKIFACEKVVEIQSF